VQNAPSQLLSAIIPAMERIHLKSWAAKFFAPNAAKLLAWVTTVVPK
jgi:hypothetical protein